MSEEVRSSIRLAALRSIPRVLGDRGDRASRARQRLLLIRPDHLGDVLFLTPALCVLREALPEAAIVAMVGPWGQEVLAGNPNVDDILICEFPGFARRPKSSALSPYRRLFTEARRLRGLRFDAALICRSDHWWGALLAYLAQIPCRIGYDLPETRPFLTVRVRLDPGQHAVQKNIGLLPALGVNAAGEPERLPLQFEPSPADEAFAAAYVDRLEEPGRVVVIHPGAGAPVKRWTADRAVIVAERLVGSLGCRLLLTGGVGEEDLVQAIAARLQVPPATALGLTLGQLGAVLRRCRLVLGPDSGVLHLAVAVGTPTVHLFGPVDERRFGPWGPAERHAVVRSSLACVPCDRLDYGEDEVAGHPCIRLIEPEAVVQAAVRILEATSARGIR